MNNKFFSIIIMVVSICGFTICGFADTLDMNQLDMNQMIKALAFPSNSDGQRSVESAGQKRAISLAIRFKKDSFELTPGAVETLDVLGKALNSNRLKSFNFLVEGYTDASGEKSYNMDLSTKRAEAVKVFLVRNYNIQADRLPTLGKGETCLVDKNNPNSSVNRRVRIVNEGR